MKKKNQKGFMLVEAFVVSSFILSLLVFMFVQLKTIVNGFDKSFTYNTIQGLYIANEFGKFIVEYDYEKTKELADENGYVNLDVNYYKNYNNNNTNGGNPFSYLWEKMMVAVGAKRIIVTHANLIKIKEIGSNSKLYEDAVNTLSPKLINYINSLNVESTDQGYRVIVEYEDQTFAATKLP